MDQDEANNSVAPPTPLPISREVSEPLVPKELESKPASPKPHPLSISFQPPSPAPAVDDGLDDALKPADDTLDAVVPDITADINIDMSELGPDGEAFEGVNDLSQLQASDDLLGGPLLDQAMEEDPFTGTSS